MFLSIGAGNTTIYILNRCPHRILEDKAPKEVFIGVKPKVILFHIFGCPIYIHIPVEKRTKLELSNMKGLFVGYSGTSKAYMIYILGKIKTIVRRDIKFEENFASRKSHETIPVIVEE